jgi:apolipoprotein N-acyltransferase
MRSTRVITYVRKPMEWRRNLTGFPGNSFAQTAWRALAGLAGYASLGGAGCFSPALTAAFTGLMRMCALRPSRRGELSTAP